MIREGKTFQLPSVMQTGRKEGMQLSDKILQDLVQKGEVTGDVAWEFANDKNQFSQYAPKGAFEGTQTGPNPAAGAAPGQTQAPGIPGLQQPLKKTG